MYLKPEEQCFKPIPNRNIRLVRTTVGADAYNLVEVDRFTAAAKARQPEEAYVEREGDRERGTSETRDSHKTVQEGQRTRHGASRAGR